MLAPPAACAGLASGVGRAREAKGNPGPDVIQVALIPFTLEHTTLSGATAGTKVHLEGDIIGKFVSRLMAARAE